MNVDSLRSGANKDARNEVRVAKVGLTLTSLFLFAWTPYFAIACIGTYGNREVLTPFLSMIPACTCKLAACIDPFVFAINHPKYLCNILYLLYIYMNCFLRVFLSFFKDIGLNCKRRCLGCASTNLLILFRVIMAVEQLMELFLPFRNRLRSIATPTRFDQRLIEVFGSHYILIAYSHYSIKFWIQYIYYKKLYSPI